MFELFLENHDVGFLQIHSHSPGLTIIMFSKIRNAGADAEIWKKSHKTFLLLTMLCHVQFYLSHAHLHTCISSLCRRVSKEYYIYFHWLFQFIEIYNYWDSVSHISTLLIRTWSFSLSLSDLTAASPACSEKEKTRADHCPFHWPSHKTTICIFSFSC